MHGVSTHGKTTLYTECTEYQRMARQHYTLNAWSINTSKVSIRHGMHGVSTHGKTTLDAECTECQKTPKKTHGLSRQNVYFVVVSFARFILIHFTAFIYSLNMES